MVLWEWNYGFVRMKLWSRESEIMVLWEWESGFVRAKRCSCKSTCEVKEEHCSQRKHEVFILSNFW